MSFETSHLGSHIDYATALAMQLDHVEKMQLGEADDTLFLLEHSPVHTIGRTRDQSSLAPDSSGSSPIQAIVTNRGGQATYHGPGQLVGYPILDLKHYGKDLHTYVRALEDSLIATCQEFSVKATTREGLTGVWIENRKLASIGVGVKKWISMHGFAINITAKSLSGFKKITPCGIQNVTMTTLEDECDLPDKPTVATFAAAYPKHLAASLRALSK